MTNLDRGRRILSAQIRLIAVATLAIVGVHVFTGKSSVARQAIHVGVTIALCCWLYRGSALARAFVVAALGLLGLIGMINLLIGTLAAFIAGISYAVYLMSAVTIALSSDVKAFLRWQRSKEVSRDAEATR